MLLAAPAWAWGPKAHQEINRMACFLLPEPLGSYFRPLADDIAALANDPDEWKLSDAGERPRHFIDLESLGKPPYDDLPRRWEEARAALGDGRLAEEGMVPWTIARWTRKLQEDFRRRRWAAAWKTAAWLGHYAADASQPLHTTANHDGQHTGNDGIHLRWEDEMVSRYYDRLKPQPSSATYQEDLDEYAFAIVLNAHEHIQEILEADKAAREEADLDTPDYFEALFSRSAEVARERIEAGAEALACLWYTAWVDAGRPAPPRTLPSRPSR